MKNAADKEQVRAARKREARDAEFSAHAWETVLATVEGRRVLFEILTVAKVMRPKWHTVPSQPTAMAFAAGQQAVGAAILERIDAQRPDGYLQILKDEAERQREARAAERIEDEQRRAREAKQDPESEDFKEE